MPRCRQATSQNLGQCWPSLCRHMASLDHNELTPISSTWLLVSAYKITLPVITLKRLTRKSQRKWRVVDLLICPGPCLCNDWNMISVSCNMTRDSIGIIASAWRLQMAWRQIGTRPSAVVMLTRHLQPSWWRSPIAQWHYCDFIMGAIASQITSLTIVYSIVYSDSDQRKHQSSA